MAAPTGREGANGILSKKVNLFKKTLCLSALVRKKQYTKGFSHGAHARTTREENALYPFRKYRYKQTFYTFYKKGVFRLYTHFHLSFSVAPANNTPFSEG